MHWVYIPLIAKITTGKDYSQSYRSTTSLFEPKTVRVRVLFYQVIKCQTVTLHMILHT